MPILRVITNWVIRNPEVHYRPYISSPLIPIVSKIYPISKYTTHLPQIHFAIIYDSAYPGVFNPRPAGRLRPSGRGLCGPGRVFHKIQCVMNIEA